MSLTRLSVAGTVIGLLAGAAPLAAQTSRPHLGPHLSYNFDAEDLGIGGQLGLPIQRRLEFYPSVDIYFHDPGSLWAANFDLKYRVSNTAPLQWLYLGSGLNLTHASFRGNGNTDAGLNLIGGFESLRGWVHPFGEARLTLGDGSAFQIAGGLNFTLGKH